MADEFVFDEMREYSDMDRALVFLSLWSGSLQDHFDNSQITQLSTLRLLTGWTEERARGAIEISISNGMVQFDSEDSNPFSEE